VFDDPEMIVNPLGWESLDALRAFVYREPKHVEVLRRGREFFERSPEESLALWVPAGAIPAVADAEERLTLLRAVGPSRRRPRSNATFRPGEVQGPVADGRELCPAPWVSGSAAGGA
jgi:hypothetical protein